VDILTARYRERLAGETLMVNELYLALLYRPAAGLAAGMLSRALSRTRSVSSGLSSADALDACAKLGQMTRASLRALRTGGPGHLPLGQHLVAPHSWSISRADQR